MDKVLPAFLVALGAFLLGCAWSPFSSTTCVKSSFYMEPRRDSQIQDISQGNRTSRTEGKMDKSKERTIPGFRNTG